MNHYRIALLPGDGVGPEICREAERILDAVTEKHGAVFERQTFDWSCDYYLQHGRMMPEDALERLGSFDAILLACIGDANKVSDHISLQLLLTIRKSFDQYVNLRPIRLFPGVYSPVKGVTPENLDMVVVRENTEGEYSGAGGFFKWGSPDGFATQTGYFTQKGCERVIKFAFELARKRKKLGDSDQVGMVTNCTKSNALNYSMVFWDSVYNQVAADYPDIRRDMALVDAITMWFVKNPDYFDVVVASNLFADILTDLGAGIVGGLGVAPSANIGTAGFPGFFEPVHGSAPDIMGKGIANPVATMFATAMMLDHLGESRAASRVDAAVRGHLAGGHRTRDLGGEASTRQAANDIIKRL